MTDTTYILAVDPGNEKTGVAIVTPSGTMVCRKIIMTKQFNGEIERILTEYYGVVHMVCGNGTNHKYLYPSLQQIGRNHRITTSLIDESHSTEAVSYTHLDVYKRQRLRNILEPVKRLKRFYSCLAVASKRFYHCLIRC